MGEKGKGSDAKDIELTSLGAGVLGQNLANGMWIEVTQTMERTGPSNIPGDLPVFSSLLKQPWKNVPDRIAMQWRKPRYFCHKKLRGALRFFCSICYGNIAEPTLTYTLVLREVHEFCSQGDELVVTTKQLESHV